jgi:hypothetical protein
MMDRDHTADPMMDRIADWYLDVALPAHDGQEPPDDACEAVRLAFFDQVIANALALGLLEQVTYPGPTARLVSLTDGKRVTIGPGEAVIILGPGGQVVRAVVAEDLPPDPDSVP